MATRLSRSLKASLTKQLQRDSQVMAQTRSIIRGQFEILHKQMMQDFETHPVTRELKSGPGSSNISGSLPRGNLFGFIGFESGDDPTATTGNGVRNGRGAVAGRVLRAAHEDGGGVAL